MSVLRVQNIVNQNNNGPVEFTRGLTLPSSQTLTGNDTVINTTTSGVGSITQLQSTNLFVGIITAGSFVGNGALITNPPGTSIRRVIGLHLIT
jgi:hypothetical protein